MEANQIRQIEEYWYHHYLQVQEQGVSVRHYSKSNSLNPSTFYGWIKKLKDRGKIEDSQEKFEHFKRVSITSQYQQSYEHCYLKFHFPNGCFLEFDSSYPRDILVSLISQWI